MTHSQNNLNFNQAYLTLNKEQKLAVDTLDGPVMVVAGPGTGKTQTIALRIANILQKTDTDASSILALTYTDSGARAMQSRLLELIGTSAYYCHISTFHSFCTDVIREYPDTFTLDPSTQPLPELDKLRLIYRLLDKFELSYLRPLGAPYLYAKSILDSISLLKREGVSEEALSALLDNEAQFLQSDEGQELKATAHSLRTKNLLKNRDLLKLYKSYEEHLASHNLFDFDDMINYVIKAFDKDNNLLVEYQERYQYLLVDEYQDSNGAQNKLLLSLTSHWQESADIFVVGDPDQSIYRFQGASIENQLGFIKHFPSAKVVTLKDNYRSSQTLLDSAYSLISHNNLRINDVVPGLDPRLRSVSGNGTKIRLVSPSTPLVEAIFIATDILSLLSRGATPGDFCIIYRNNADAYLLANTFAKLGLTTSSRGGSDVLSNRVVQNFLTLLRTINKLRRHQDDEDFFTVLHYPIFRIDPLDILRLSRLAGDKRLSLFECLSAPALLDSLELSSRQALDSFLAKLSSWSKYDAEHTFTEFFEEVLSSSGFLSHVLSSSTSLRDLSALNTLFEEAKSMNQVNPHLNLALFLENLDLMQINKIRLVDSKLGENPASITLTTAHSSKGLEWEHVYIYHASDKLWGNARARELIKLPDELLQNVKPSDKEKNEDDRRLFYVAVTRAKKSLTISYPASSSPSLFISELGVGVELLETASLEAQASSLLPKLLSHAPVLHQSEAEQALLQPLADNFTLSPTSLNSYLECAYKFKLDKLIRVPHSKKPHLSFGTAIHKALELFYKQFQNEGSLPSKNFLLNSFHKSLTRQVISASDLKRYLLQGDKVLSSYFDLLGSEPTELKSLEESIMVHLGDIKLSGKFDRLEWLDKEAKSLRLVDYKTGQTKSMGEILGTTAGSRGDLKRQLIFYKLLLSLDKRYKGLSLGEAVLDFVQSPAEKGKDGRRRLQVSDSEVTELRELIIQTMRHIRELKFPRTTDLNICQKCYFQAHCYPNGLPIIT